MSQPNAATPSLSLDLQCMIEKYRKLQHAFFDLADICFAVKANNHPSVLRRLIKIDSGFDVASGGEIEQITALGVRGHRIMFSNPVKKPDDLIIARESGVRKFAIDCADEVTKIAAIVPGAQVYVRMTVPNVGSGWPLTKKFGVHPEEAIALMLRAKAAGLVPIGVTFHVGSQCTNVSNWRAALQICEEVWRGAMQRGIATLSLIDMGGGFPVAYHEQRNAPTPMEIGLAVRDCLMNRFPGLVSVVLEPGRYLVAEAGTLYSSVIATAVRDGERIAYLDCGLFNGMMEAYEWKELGPEKFWYPVTLEGDEAASRPAQVVTLMGPSCDSVDEIVRGFPFKELRMGDVLRFDMAGAYTNSYEHYNGLKYPSVHQIQSWNKVPVRVVDRAAA